MSIQISLSSDASSKAGIGGGLHLMSRNAIKADDTYTDGLYWLRPWDLTEFGPAGEAAIAANGGRYAWLVSSDHYDQTTAGWARGGGIHIAFNNDIALPPKAFTEIIAHTFTADSPNTSNVQLETPWLLWKVEDETDPFRLYGHAVNNNSQGQHTWVYKSSDLLTWTRIGVSHNAGGGHAGYQRVFRNGLNDYFSFGLNGNNTANAIWTSTDAETFTEGTNRSTAIGNRQIVNSAGPSYLVGAQRYFIAVEDARHASLGEGQFICACPISDTYELPADNSGIIRISSTHAGVYPGPKYLQGVEYAIEDGIAHIFAKRGFFADVGITAAADYGSGGGYDDQIADYYAYVVDETAARASAPAGVRASVVGGVVTLRWYDALPQRTYRVYRATSADLSGKTLVGDVTGTQATDTPESPGTYYYQVVTLDGSDEEGARIVSPYVSAKSSLVNEHVARVVADGGDPATIDLDYLEWAEDVLDELGIKDDLSYWVMPEFGHVKDGSNVLSKVYCLGSTIHPRGGDLAFTTSNTTYNATAWNSLPAWTSSSASAFGRFGNGRVNNIRRARNSGLTLIASVQRSHTNVISPFGWGEQTPSYFLQVGSGSPGAVAMTFQGTTDTHGTTIANNDDHIIGAVITSALVKTSVEGVLSTGTARSSTTSVTDQLNGQRGSGGGNSHLLGFGSNAFKMNAVESSSARTYSYGSNQAQMICRHLIAIRRGLDDTQMATLNTRLRDGPQ